MFTQAWLFCRHISPTRACSFFSNEAHKLPFPNVGTISSIKVALVNKGGTPSGTRKRGFIADWTNGKWIPKHEKRFLFSTDGWTLESVSKHKR